MKRVAIVGGGIAGLATAYHLQKAGRGAVDYTLIESAPYLGGKIKTHSENGFLVEAGPDSFVTLKPSAVKLCRELGLAPELISTNNEAQGVFVWSRDALRAMPEGLSLMVPSRLMPFVRSPLISWSGKMRMGMEMFIPPRKSTEDESLATFVRRRLGREALDRIAEPMIAGIYVADADRLSMQSTFPRFLEMEHVHGGLLRSMIARRHAAHRNGNGHQNGKAMFMSLRGGMQQMIASLVSRLQPGSLLTGCSVQTVSRENQRFTLSLSDGTRLAADEVVFATPAFITAQLVQKLDAELTDELRGLRYVSTATVSLGFRRSDLTHPLNGFGFVVPRCEDRKLRACTWSSQKFSGRAPEGHVLLRAFVGGAGAEHFVNGSDAEIAAMVRDDLRTMMGIAAEPVLSKVYRWENANPQYDVGHQARIGAIDKRVAHLPGVHLGGAAYHGVGIPDCIDDGTRIATRILQN